jgi:hypothetical protein
MSKNTKNWVVTTSGDRPLGDVANDLRKSGLKVADILTEIGCITGEGSDAAAEKARKVRGVTDVSVSAPIDIGPPNSPDTW